LAKLLGDDLRGSFGIKESVADDLPHQFVSAAIVSLRTTWLVAQSNRALFLVRVKELEIALFGVPVFLGRLGWPKPLTLALDEHGEFLGHFVFFNEGQTSMFSD
jgi:hypothetical protein